MTPGLPSTAGMSIGQSAVLACLLEVSAPKPGNVHRGADFDDLTLDQFLVSAVAIGPAMDRADRTPLGRTILDAVEATRRAVGTNSNLGLVLLLAPLAAAARDVPLAAGVRDVLSRLTSADARDVYAAIRLARPGGLGRADRHDVAGPPPENLLDAMQLAADRDLVARQYVDGFHEVLEEAVPWIRSGLDRGRTLAEAVVHAQMRLMAAHGDGLILRKCGPAVSAEAAARAAAVLASGGPGEENYHAALADLDFWLRADGRRRNPGTTADLLGASLFAILRE